MTAALGRMHLLFYSIAILFVAALVLTLEAGVNPYVAVIWNVLSALNVSYSLLVPFSISQNPYILAADILDTIAFALLTVVLATVFFNFIKRVNIRSHIIDSKVGRLKGHVVIAPDGKFSRYLAEQAHKSGLEAVIITHNEKERIELHRRGILAVIGDIKSVEAFEEAGIGRASKVVACSDSDIENALVAITAKAANPHIEIISRVGNEDNVVKIGSAGALHMVMPEITVGSEIGDVLIKKFG
ncbi:MAG: NAD-binding protein [Candidatus Micrarchaeaceae archaeon]